MTVLQTGNLTKRYGDMAAVDDVSLTVEKGDIYGLIGQNGAGKTTLLRMITSLSQPTGGSMELFGAASPAALAKARSRLGSIIETPALYPNLTAAQNLEYYRIQRGIPDKTAVGRALEAVKLTDTGKKKFKHFSLGMKQRLGVALAILGSPDLILLDEPINGLDPMGIVEMREMLARLPEQGVTVFISSHILAELAQIATKYAIMHKGRLITQITQAQLAERCNRAVFVTVDDAPKAAVILETKLNIRHYKQVGGNELRVYEPVSDPAELTFQLNSAGVRVSAVGEVGDTLEDFFLETIGEAR